MAEENSPWLTVFGLVGVVAVVTMLITVKTRETEPEWVGETFAKRAPPPPSAPTAPQIVQEEPAPRIRHAAVLEAPPPEAPPTEAPQVHGIARTAEPAAPRAPAQAPVPGKKEGVINPKEGEKLDGIWDKHVAKSALMQRYDKELRKDPYLNALMDTDSSDVFGRLKAEFSSKHFRQTTLKFAASGDMVKFLMDSIKGLSPGSLSKVGNELNHDKVAKDFVNDISESSGIPTGLLLGGGKAPSQQEMVDAALKHFQQDQPPGTTRR